MSEELDDYVYGERHMTFIAALLAQRVQPEDSGEQVRGHLAAVIAQWSDAVRALADERIEYRGPDGTLYATVEIVDEEVEVMARTMRG